MPRLCDISLANCTNALALDPTVVSWKQVLTIVVRPRRMESQAREASQAYLHFCTHGARGDRAVLWRLPAMALARVAASCCVLMEL